MFLGFSVNESTKESKSAVASRMLFAASYSGKSAGLAGNTKLLILLDPAQNVTALHTAHEGMSFCVPRGKQTAMPR
jgi:hypothetical protein